MNDQELYQTFLSELKKHPDLPVEAFYRFKLGWQAGWKVAIGAVDKEYTRLHNEELTPDFFFRRWLTQAITEGEVGE